MNFKQTSETVSAKCRIVQIITLWVPGSQAINSKCPTPIRAEAVSRYNQVMTPSRTKMPSTGHIRDGNAAVHQVQEQGKWRRGVCKKGVGNNLILWTHCQKLLRQWEVANEGEAWNKVGQKQNESDKVSEFTFKEKQKNTELKELLGSELISLVIGGAD